MPKRAGHGAHLPNEHDYPGLHRCDHFGRRDPVALKPGESQLVSIPSQTIAEIALLCFAYRRPFLSKSIRLGSIAPTPSTYLLSDRNVSPIVLADRHFFLSRWKHIGGLFDRELAS